MMIMMMIMIMMMRMFMFTALRNDAPVGAMAREWDTGKIPFSLIVLVPNQTPYPSMISKES